MQAFENKDTECDIPQLRLSLTDAKASLLCSTSYKFVLVQVSVSLWNFIRFKNSLSLLQNVWNGVSRM